MDSIGDVDALLNALRREQPLPQDRGDLNRAANEQRVSLTGIARIEIQYTSDTVNLFRSETSELLVKEFMNRREPELLARIEVSGSTLRIRHGTRRLFLFPPFRSRIEIYLPAGYRGELALRTASGSIRIHTALELAALELHAASGSIHGELPLAAAGALEAESASGSIHLAEATAKRLRLQAASGSLHLRRLTALEAAELRSTSGSLHLGELTAGSLDLGTASGSMRAECLRAAEGLRLHTTSGSIQLQRAEGRMELATSSGSIVVEGCRGAGSCATSSGSIRMRVEELQGDLSLRASSGGIRLGLAGGVACNLRAKTVSGGIHTNLAGLRAAQRRRRRGWRRAPIRDRSPGRFRQHPYCRGSTYRGGRNMKDQLRSHVELLFADAPKTHRAFDLKEELYANLLERYEDLLARGVSEQDAYENVVNSIGDVSELFTNLEETPLSNSRTAEQQRKRSALIVAISVGLYIVAGMVLIAGGLTPYAEYGFLAALAVALVPTCLLVYNANAYPKYVKREDTMVEDFKRWKSDSRKQQALQGSIISVIWTVVLVLYFLISFLTGAWYITWILFIVAVCLTAIVNLVFHAKELKE